MMLLAMDPPKHVDVPASARAELQGARHGAAWKAASARSAARSCRTPPSAATSSSSTTSPRCCRRQVDRRADGTAARGLGRDPHDGGAQHPQPGPRDHGRPRTPTRVRAARSIDMAMYAIQFAAERRSRGTARGPDVADPRHRLRRRADERHRVRQLLRAARHRRATTRRRACSPTACSRCSSTPTSSPSCAPIRRSLPGAVEEILRYENPLHYFRRTATADTELHGQPIAAGDKVRDDLHVGEPRRRRVRRPAARSTSAAHPNPHLSFGIAEHFCLGVHLARLEGVVFFEELFATFPTIELTGEPRRTRSNLNNSLKGCRLPGCTASATDCCYRLRKNLVVSAGRGRRRRAAPGRS